jgi:hypothetical protein
VTKESFEATSHGKWQWLITVAVITFLTAASFVLIELFRETKMDGSSQVKGRGENLIEGVCLFSLVLAWIPTVVFATAPGGQASLVGNAYFFTWLLVIFIFEGLVWYIHDMRMDLHRALKEKEEEYRRRQKQVLEDSKRIQRKGSVELYPVDDRPGSPKRRAATEYFDTDQGF